MVSLFFLISSPIFLFAVKNRKKFIQNLLNVLIGKKSIVGYQEQNTTTIDLPRIKPGILHPADELTINDDSITDKLNLIYARDYKVVKDFTIVSKAFKKLDR